MTVDVKDRKLLSKLVPYEVEESIVTPVDELVFVYGELADGVVETAYTHAENTLAQIEELEALEADVQSVVCDYHELSSESQWVMLMDDDQVIVRHGTALGFSCDVDAAPIYIAAMKHDAPPSAIHLIADSEEGLDQMRSWLPEGLETNEDVEILEQEGGFWDVMSLSPKPALDFRSGPLARKLPFGQWWADWKVPAIAAGVAFVIALGTTWGELQQAKSLQKKHFAERDEIFRQVVPTGSISDPVRQLKSKLKKKEVTEPSSAVYLLSKVAPKVVKVKGLDITAFRYSQNNKTLQLNLEAPEYVLIEGLQNAIKAEGLKAEIKRSSVSGDIHQAQLRVSES